MANYARMYYRLFNAQADVIKTLQRAQQEAEEIYLTSPEPNLQVLYTHKPESEDKE